MHRIKHDRPVLFVLAILLAGCLMSFSAFASLGEQDGEPDASESTSEEGTEAAESQEESMLLPHETQGDGEAQQEGELAQETPDPLPSSVTSGGSTSLPTTGRTLGSMVAFGVTGLALVAAGMMVMRKRSND